jgi:molybdate transport system substrate-binding protein
VRLAAAVTLALAAFGVAALMLLRPAADLPAGRTGPPPLRIAVAADLRFAFGDLEQEFQQAHPDVRVEAAFGSSGGFFAQLSNRAPFDMFLSADLDYPRRLTDAGLAFKDSLFVYAIGHLAVWVRKSSALNVEKDGVQVVLDASVRKIAIANPRHAPYGRAAEAALQKLGLYDRVRERLVYGENVAQTAQFVQAGSAEVGIIALSLARSPALAGAGRYQEVPPETYPRLEQGGVILSWARDRESADAFRAFLLSGRGRAVLRRYGFFVPEG